MRRTRPTIGRQTARALLLALLGVALAARASGAQEADDAATSRRAREAINQSRDPLLRGFPFRSLGPASMGGRVDDIDVAPSDHDIVYVGFATGGVFKSVNNATTFEPVFETYGSASIGDIAIHPTNPNIVYVGTGEANNRQSSSYGDGIYKSTDGGRHFTNIGLRGTQTIARIVIDPRNPEIVYVAAPGHLFGPSADGALYKSIDGGTRWTKSKYIDENTGFTDVVIDPSNSNVLYAASYQRRRRACCFNGGGPGSALWKTTDGGAHWTRLTGHGLPPGPYGRIALDVSRSNPRIVYAQIEAGTSHLVYPDAEHTASAATASPPRAVPGAPPVEVNTTPGGDAARYWCNNAVPATAERGGADPRAPKPTPILDPTQGGVFRSDDGGRTWTARSNCSERPMYFAQLRVDPHDSNTIYTSGGVPAISRDGGRHFEKLDAVHSDNHAMWIDPENSRHLIVGNDGGVNISYDQGLTWDFVNSMATGQSYSVAADSARPYNVYTGMQDNGTWGGPGTSRARAGIVDGDWFRLPCIGDGFATAVNPEHPNIVYCEGQDGSIQRFDLDTGKGTSIRPVSGPAIATTPLPCIDGRAPDNPRLGRRGGRRTVLNAHDGDTYRFNWNTPFILSPHDPDVVYLGGNRLFRSDDGGDHWVASADLTKQIDRCALSVMGVRGDEKQLAKNDGIEWYGTIVSVAESPVAPGVIWAGTDDGNLQISHDSGQTFTEVGRNLPGLPRDNDYWISRIDASHFDPGTAFIAVDGHRSDDMKPYIFVTHDYGQSFRSITTGLPAYGNVRVVREDPGNRNLLFAGTELGLYASLDGGARWERFMTNYPTVRTDDILIHPREGDLIAATHGRSLWIADDITPLEQLTPEIAAQDAHLFQPRETVAWIRDLTNSPDLGGVRHFVGENAPGPAISYYLGTPASSDVRVTISDSAGRVVVTSSGPRDIGIHKLSWAALATGERGRRGAPRLEARAYTVTLTVDGKRYTRMLNILKDRWFRAQ